MADVFDYSAFSSALSRSLLSNVAKISQSFSSFRYLSYLYDIVIIFGNLLIGN
jgi:hypothetical protein